MPTEYDRGSSTQGDRPAAREDGASDNAPNMSSALQAEESSADEDAFPGDPENAKSNDDDDFSSDAND